MNASLMTACLLISGFGSTLFAQEARQPHPTPIPIKDGKSPDGLRDITITDTSTDESGAEGIGHVRDLRTGKTLGSFEWHGFGVRPDAEAFSVLWRPDGRAFATATEITRGYVECRAYAVAHDGRCQQVRLPDIVAAIVRKYHLETRDKGGEHPEKWLPGDRLAIDVYNRGWGIKNGGDVEQPYRVTLRFPRASSRSPKAVLESIQPVPVP